jgi:hypothetical protein
MKVVSVKSPMLDRNLRPVAARFGDSYHALTDVQKQPDSIVVDLSTSEALSQSLTASVPQPDVLFCFNDKRILIAATVAEEMGIAINSVLAMRDARDKIRMKRKWLAAGVGTSELIATDTAELAARSGSLCFPLIVKPSGGFSSVGVKRVADQDELDRQVSAIRRSNLALFSGIAPGEAAGLLVEAFVPGDEYAVESLWQDGELLFSFVFTRDSMEGPFYHDGLYKIDPRLDRHIWQTLVDASGAANRALGIRNGPTHTEIKLDAGKPYVIETAFRAGADGITFDVLSSFTGQNYFVPLYETLTGRPVSDGFTEDWQAYDSFTDAAFMYCVSTDSVGTVVRLDGEAELSDRSEIVAIYPLVAPGYKVMGTEDLLPYACWIVGRIPSARDLDPVLANFERTIRVVVE